MAETTYPGVYIEEKAGAPAPIQGVASSVLGLVGWTEKGPVNDPVLVTGFKEFERKFGGFTADGLVPTTLHAFFKNGGQQARIVRVAGAGAEGGVAYFSEPVADEDSGVDGDDAATTISFTVDTGPIEPGSFTHSHWRRSTVVTGATTVVTAPDGTMVKWYTAGYGGLIGQFIVPAGMLDGIEPGSVTITWDSGGAKTMTDDGAGGFTGDGNAAGSTINYLTGAIEFDATGDVPAVGLASTITIGYRPMVSLTDAVDDGAGAITGTNIASGTIDYDTGEVAITYTVAPSAVYPLASSGPAQSLLVSYGGVLWQVDMQWPGSAGNSYSCLITGTPGNEVDATATYSLWTFQVLEDGVVVEQFTGLDFDDSTSASFFPTVLNDSESGSSLVTIVDVGNTGVPTSLAGILATAEGVTESPTPDSTVKQFTFTLVAGSCSETTLTITATASDDSVLTVVDDGSGNLTGDVLGSGTNSIDYDTGEIDVTFDLAVKVGTQITVTYYSQPAESSHEEDIAGGTDGSAITSSDIVGASLEADNEGLYALNKTDDMLMVGVPDFAGDEVLDQSVVDYCTARMDRFALLATTEGMAYDAAVTYKRRTLARNSSSYAAIYWPWVTILDPVTEVAINVPPIGHVAGVYARTDASKNIGKAPAGATDGSLRFLLGLEQSPTREQVGVLTRGNVNALVDWSAVGSPSVWGARTLELNGEFGYVQHRRLFMYIEKTVYNAMHVYVFENNTSALWARIKLQLGGYLGRLFNAGWFSGETAEDAYFIVVDETNNPAEDRAAGRLTVDIGIAPNNPAEFLVFRFQKKADG